METHGVTKMNLQRCLNKIQIEMQDMKEAGMISVDDTYKIYNLLKELSHKPIKKQEKPIEKVISKIPKMSKTGMIMSRY